MGLLDRIGTVLKKSAAGSAPPAQPQQSAQPAAPAPAPAPAGKDAPPTTGLFGGGDAATAAPAAEATAPSTKGLFGAPPGEDEAQAAAPAAPATETPKGTKGLFGGTDAPGSTVPAPDADAKQAGILPVYPKVLMIVHDPPVPSEGNKRLTQIFKWHDPDQLAKGYIEDLRNCSGGYLNYQIVERIDSDIFPPKQDGFAYSGDEYVKVIRQQSKPHDPDYLDYRARIEQFDLQNRFNNGDFDEVWFFSFPYGGEYESIMGGPDGFWCNAPPIKNTDRFRRRFVMMGFNMERGVDCMLENFGHRTESIMTELYKKRGKKQDMWKLFTQYEKQNPGDAQCGWMHYAPNSVKDYDWGNTTPVTSYCDDWYSYPTLPHEGKTMDNKTWGGGDMRKHHIWWFDHIPKTTGETDGISNNWWEYAVDPNKV